MGVRGGVFGVDIIDAVAFFVCVIKFSEVGVMYLQDIRLLLLFC